MALTRLGLNQSINLASNVTGTLPKANGGTGATSFTAGVTEADQWRMNSSLTLSSQQDMNYAWERSDTFFDKIGTGLTESSGVFTFPSTGIYKIDYHGNFRDSAGDRGISMQLYVSSNSGGAYTFAASLEINLSDIGGSENTTTGGGKCCIVDVTDASTFRFKFKVGGASGQDITMDGNTTAQYSGFTCIRLGDT